MMLRLSFVFLVAGFLSVTDTLAAAPSSVSAFVRPAELERDIAFWRRIYTEVTTDGGFVHDNERLDIVYDVLGFPEGLAPARRARQIDEAKERVTRALRKLGSRDPGPLSADEARVRDQWPAGTSRAEFAAAAERVRFQLGQANRFREGLVRSGAWMPMIEATFVRQGLPRELAALPHVESSFNPYAYSKVGAAGMWQFMRSTGRRYLHIDNLIDERLDPYRSTVAAARFLEQNHAALGSWPLALTAYNHGAAGMRRAREAMGTDDIAKIVRGYRSRTFGFASRNFYVAFLAAVEIDADPERFFGPLRRNPPDSSVTGVLPDYVPARSLATAFGVGIDELKRLNPSLLPPVWNGSRHVPRGFELRMPAGVDLSSALARLPPAERFASQVADTHHVVASGESLSVIAARHGVPLSVLAELNGLAQPYPIRAGQRLVLPDRGPTVNREPMLASNTPPPMNAAPGSDERYVVRRGDTLSRIAGRVGLTEEALMDLNGLRDRNFIHEGQVLSITPAASRADTPSSAARIEAAVEVAAAPAGPTAATEAAEPTSEGEAEALGPTLVPGVQAAVSADPSDYTVAADDSIRVEAAETLGHYAEWLDVRSGDLRALNRMRADAPVVIGRRIRLDFSRVSAREFEDRRVAYHRQLQETFFARYRIVGSETHVVRSGDSIWVLAQRQFNVPIWLLRQYNPDVDLGAVRPGTRLVIPQLAASEGSAAS